MNEAEYEDLHASLKQLDNEVFLLSKALHQLKEAASLVIDRVDSPKDELDDAISGLEEAMPCDDCLQAPCRCPE